MNPVEIKKESEKIIVAKENFLWITSSGWRMKQRRAKSLKC